MLLSLRCRIPSVRVSGLDFHLLSDRHAWRTDRVEAPGLPGAPLTEPDKCCSHPALRDIELLLLVASRSRDLRLSWKQPKLLRDNDAMGGLIPQYRQRHQPSCSPMAITKYIVDDWRVTERPKGLPSRVDAPPRCDLSRPKLY